MTRCQGVHRRPGPESRQKGRGGVARAARAERLGDRVMPWSARLTPPAPPPAPPPPDAPARRSRDCGTQSSCSTRRAEADAGRRADGRLHRGAGWHRMPAAKRCPTRAGWWTARRAVMSGALARLLQAPRPLTHPVTRPGAGSPSSDYVSWCSRGQAVSVRLAGATRPATYSWPAGGDEARPKQRPPGPCGATGETDPRGSAVPCARQGGPDSARPDRYRRRSHDSHDHGHSPGHSRPECGRLCVADRALAGGIRQRHVARHGRSILGHAVRRLRDDDDQGHLSPCSILLVRRLQDE